MGTFLAELPAGYKLKHRHSHTTTYNCFTIPLLFTEAFPLSSLRSGVDSDGSIVRYRPRSTTKHRPAKVAIL